MRDPETGRAIYHEPFTPAFCARAVRDYIELAIAEPRWATRDRWLPTVSHWIDYALQHYYGDGDLELVESLRCAFFGIEEERIEGTPEAQLATDRALDALFIAGGLEPFFLPEEAGHAGANEVSQNAPSPTADTVEPDVFNRNLDTTGGVA